MTLTYEQLNNSLLDTITTIVGYQPQLKELMSLLYSTGVRPVESLDKNRWSVLLNGKVQLVTAKNSGIRIFEETELPTAFYTDLVNGRWLFSDIRSSQSMYFFLKLWQYSKAKVGDKVVGLYAFRYRYVKYLVLEGYSPSEIQNKMGWSNVNLVHRYNGAEIDF